MGKTAEELRLALRDLRIELSLNTHRVAAVAGLNDSDLSVLDVLTREGPHSPTALARRTGLHAATMTGVLARLEKAGWVARLPDTADRRARRIEPTGAARLTDLYQAAGGRLEQIAAGLSAEQAETVLNYLRAVTDAVHAATQDLDSLSGR